MGQTSNSENFQNMLQIYKPSKVSIWAEVELCTADMAEKEFIKESLKIGSTSFKQHMAWNL